MLEIKNVHKTFNKGTINEKKALNGVNLVLNEGDFVTVIGSNGAGKSTLLNIISGLLQPSSGEIKYNDPEVKNNLDKMGYMFQKDFLFPWLLSLIHI